MTGIWSNLDWSVPLNMLISVIPALLCITLHELSHGAVAYALGDDTAKRMGRLTLNPIKHIDIFGLLMMVVFHFGWAKPVPVNMYRFKNPKKGMAITALAGPACNIVLSAVMLLVYGFVFVPLSKAHSDFCDGVLSMIMSAAYMSLALAIFNIIPIPPLDGSKILFALLPPAAYDKLMRFERFGMILLLVVVASGILGTPLSAATRWVFEKMFPIARFSYDLVRNLT